MYKVKVGDFVKHKGNCGPEAMLVCAVRKEDDLPMGQVVMKVEAREFPIGCRWWDAEKKRFQLEWFAVEELELWKE